MQTMQEESENRPAKRDSVPTERAYVHQHCGQATVVSGNDFSRLVNPFAFVSATYCVSCQGAFSLAAFSWEDTGESILAYRRRMRRMAPLSFKLCGWVVGPLLSGLIGAAIGWLFTPQEAKGPIIGGLMGLLIAAGFLMPLLAKWIWGIDYRAER
jgi:hypothetical protein